MADTEMHDRKSRAESVSSEPATMTNLTAILNFSLHLHFILQEIDSSHLKTLPRGPIQAKTSDFKRSFFSRWRLSVIFDLP